MAIKNKRTSIEDNASESRLARTLQENFKRFIKEGDEDEMDAAPEEGEDEGGMPDMAADDMNMGDFDNEETGAMDDGMTEDPLANLSNSETEQVEQWVDSLLQDSLSQVDAEDDDSLSTEASADSLDPMGQDQYVHDDLPMTNNEMQDIIDNDDSLGALENKLAGLVQDEMGDEDGLDGLGDLTNDSIGDDEVDPLDEAYELTDEDGNQTKGLPDEIKIEEGIVTNPYAKKKDSLEDMPALGEENADELEEAMELVSQLKQHGFDQGFEGEDTKDELTEDVALAQGNKELGFEETSKGLNDDINSTVNAGGVKGGAKTNVDKVSFKESIKKSHMLVKAAGAIAHLKKQLDEAKKREATLKFENYKLMKTNGLLSAAGDFLSKEARTQIAESFEKCKTMEQVNKFYANLTEKIKTAARPSLNEAVSSVRSRINVIKEASSRPEQNESVSMEQARKNYLMGIPGTEDMYGY